MSNTSHSSQSLEFPILMIYSFARSNIWKRNSTFGKTKANLFKWLCILFCELWMQCTLITNGHNLDCYEETNSLNLINSYVAISWTSIFSRVSQLIVSIVSNCLIKNKSKPNVFNISLSNFVHFPLLFPATSLFFQNPNFSGFNNHKLSISRLN